MNQPDQNVSLSTLPSVPLMTRAAFAAAVGLPIGVLVAQAERGLWGAPVKIGKRAFINVEYVRLLAVKQAQEFLS